MFSSRRPMIKSKRTAHGSLIPRNVSSSEKSSERAGSDSRVFGHVFSEERSTRLDTNRIESSRRWPNPENEIPRFVLCTLEQSFANSSVSFGYRIIRTFRVRFWSCVGCTFSLTLSLSLSLSRSLARSLALSVTDDQCYQIVELVASVIVSANNNR